MKQACTICLLLMSATAWADDLAGNWTLTINTLRGEQHPTLVINRDGDELTIAGHRFHVPDLNRIAVVGAGKAGAGMAAAVDSSLGKDIVREKVTGWVNVPADCLQPTKAIHLHAARPAGVNEPTAEGVKGTQEILRLAASVGRISSRQSLR